ncbi:MAG: hypothetical protein GF368_01790 [Candidatus Aenigmarchaeota archaeon]|nr:hypothetical protein [Candidatus Aenigmarchaeota archaeon]
MNKDLIIDDEFKTFIPPLTEEEFSALEQSIINEGCRDPLVIWDNIILDGHNRYNICMKHNLIFKRVEKNFDNKEQAKIWILENQLGRRNLNEAQRIDVVDRLFGLKEQQDAKERTKMGKENLPDPKKAGQSRDKLGQKAKVSGRTYQKGKKIKDTNTELWDQCKQGEISIDKAYKEVQNQEKEQKREEKSKQGEHINPKDYDITFKQGDFIDVLDDIADNSVDLILTDPPYPIDYIAEWSKLGEFAKKKLKKHGFLIAYCGHKNLYQSMLRLEVYLDYYWIFSLKHSGNTKLISFNNIEAGWKPILVYQKGFKKIPNKTKDFIEGAGRSKFNHEWEQSLGELEYLITQFTNENNIVVDPFAGSGTVLVASKKLKRISIGAEQNKKTYNIAKKRIYDDL